MNKKAFKTVRDKLSEFEGASPYDTKEIELCMDALASAIFLAFKAEDDEEEPNSLAEAVDMLPIPRSSKHKLEEICSEITEVLEATDYESDDEDHEDLIGELQSDFYSVLNDELVKLEKL